MNTFQPIMGQWHWQLRLILFQNNDQPVFTIGTSEPYFYPLDFLDGKLGSNIRIGDFLWKDRMHNLSALNWSPRRFFHRNPPNHHRALWSGLTPFQRFFDGNRIVEFKTIRPRLFPVAKSQSLMLYEECLTDVAVIVFWDVLAIKVVMTLPFFSPLDVGSIRFGHFYGFINTLNHQQSLDLNFGPPYGDAIFFNMPLKTLVLDWS